MGRALRRLIAATAVTAVATLGFAPAAYADDRLVDRDFVKISSAGFDFGDGAWNLTTWDKSGKVRFLVDENDVTPVVEGKLGLHGVNGECARMRVDYYSITSIFLTTKYGGTVCAPDNGFNAWTVDLSPYTSDKVGKVKVSVEHQLSSGAWAIVGSDWATMDTYVDDTVAVRETDGGGVFGIGFGDSGWTGGNPTGFGQTVWEFANGQINPRTTGFLHMEGVAGDCVRMRIDYYSDTAYLATDYGGEVCANTNSHYVWSVDRQGYSDSETQRIRVAIESRVTPTTWAIIDTTWSYFGT